MDIFTEDWLRDEGVEATPDELTHFAQVIYGEFEWRVGDVLTRLLTDKQVAEFESLMRTGADMVAWLEVNYPDFPKVVEGERTKLIRQFRRATDKPAFLRDLAVKRS